MTDNTIWHTTSCTAEPAWCSCTIT